MIFDIVSAGLEAARLSPIAFVAVSAAISATAAGVIWVASQAARGRLLR